MQSVSEHPLPSHKGYVFLAATIAGFGVFCFGAGVGWASFNYTAIYPALTHKFNFRFTPDSWAWTNVMMPLGATCSSLPMGWVLQRYGSRTLMLFHLLPYLFGWTFLNFAVNVEMVYVGRFLLGIAGAALCVGVPVYNVEISRMSSRGAMGSTFYGSMIFGVVVVDLLAHLVNKIVAIKTCLMMTTLSFLLVIVPQSPTFYMLHDRPEMAEVALHWLHGKHQDPKVTRFLDKLPAMNDEYKEAISQGNWWQSESHKQAMRGVSRASILLILYQLSGGLIISAKLEDLLGITTKLRLELSLGFDWGAMLLGYIMCLVLVDRVGRRTLILISTVIMLFCSVYLCSWFKWLQYRSWHTSPLFALILLSASFSMGLGPLAWTMSVELIPETLRPLGCAVATTLCWLVATLQQISFVYRLYQISYFYLMLIVCMLTVLFVITMIPETKGLTTEELQNDLKWKSMRRSTPA